MPKIWERAVEHIRENSPGVNPYAAATATLQKAGEMKPGTRELTKKGEKRQAKGPKWRHAHPLWTGGVARAPSLGRAGRHG
jgi:hypothetical protein